MTHPTDRNRLGDAASPYLQQHAGNPVNWQPWDDRARSLAREHDVPIFLSVGYAACHWCHVMAEESFEDEAVARVLNDSSVPIKVDREQRPDLDRVYQTICQRVTGRGGWPLSVWLTPEGQPFFVGTYFPPEGTGGQQPGFRDLCERLATAWREDRDEIERRADQWSEAIRGALEETPETPVESADVEEASAFDDSSAHEEPRDFDALLECADAALRAADREHGGFGSGGAKFPQPGRLHALLWAWDRTGRDSYRTVVRETLDAMADRGLYDHLGGGFHRYATDREWGVPHFEKMLYDQGELVRAFLAGWQATGRERYREVARETLAFLDRELAHPEGGFYATLAARSEGPETGERQEGAFYTWRPDQVEAAIDDEESAEIVSARYGVTDSGNVDGASTLRRVRSIERLADQFDRSEREIRDRLESGTEALRAAREDRPRPPRDEKVIAGWNGLAISAFAEAGIVLDGAEAAAGNLDGPEAEAENPPPPHAERALEALWFVREELWNDETETLSRRYMDGDVSGAGFLDDYAFLARGAFDCYQATGDPAPLEFAMDLARVIERDFWEPDHGTLYLTPSDGESLVARPQERRDQSTPASLGVALSVLCSLDGFRPDDDYRSIVERTLATHTDRLRSSPIEHPSLALVADRHARGDTELTIAAETLPAAWRRSIAETHLPKRLLALRPPDAAGVDSWCDRLGLAEPGAIWAGREALDSEATVYACRDFTCSSPTVDLDAALEWLRGTAETPP